MVKRCERSVFSLLILILISSCSLWPEGAKQDPKERKAQIYYSHGTAQLIDKEYTEALTNLLKAAKLDPDNSKIQNNLGMAYYFKKRDDLAINHFKEALKIDKENSDARNNLASIYLTQKKYELAEIEYKKITLDLTYPHQYRVLYNLGLIKLDQGFLEAALNYFSDSLKENKVYCPALFKRAQIYFNTKRYDLALENFNKAGKGTCYNDPAPQYYQGLCFVELKDVERANKKFAEIIKRFPSSLYAKQAKQRLKWLQESKILYIDDDKKDI